MSDWISRVYNKEMNAPFIISSDNEYYSNLRKRYTYFIKQLNNISADQESIQIAIKYTNKVCEALREYYKGKIGACHRIIKNLIKGCVSNELALSDLNDSRAFPGCRGSEIQFFRARISNDATGYSPQDMVHIPYNMRSITKSDRFSIPGVPSLYLSNTSYGCWIELGCPAERSFHVSPVVLDGKQKVFNLAVMTRDCTQLNDGDESRVHCWIKLLVLMIATSYVVEENNRSFKSEYIISQSVMLACKELQFDGVAYYSKRVYSELFSMAAINLALFVDYLPGQNYGEICQHLKIDESMNYLFFKQLTAASTYQDYSLRIVNTPWITNIGNFKHQYKYSETVFYLFDMHLFGRWSQKDKIDWGNVIN